MIDLVESVQHSAFYAKWNAVAPAAAHAMGYKPITSGYEPHEETWLARAIAQLGDKIDYQLVRGRYGLELWRVGTEVDILDNITLLSR